MKLNTPDLIGSRIIECDTLVPLEVSQGKACHLIQRCLCHQSTKSLFSGLGKLEMVNKPIKLFTCPTVEEGYYLLVSKQG